ncbi:hypothetical protein VUR80DRAFT_485 [Thermomyces stellatus]
MPLATAVCNASSLSRFWPVDTKRQRPEDGGWCVASPDYTSRGDELYLVRREARPCDLVSTLADVSKPIPRRTQRRPPESVGTEGERSSLRLLFSRWIQGVIAPTPRIQCPWRQPAHIDAASHLPSCPSRDSPGYGLSGSASTGGGSSLSQTSCRRFEGVDESPLFRISLVVS